MQLKEGTVIALRTEVATAVASVFNLSLSQEQKYRLSRITGYNEAEAASRRIVARNGTVLPGIDQLEASDFEALRQFGTSKPRIALLTSQAAVDTLGHRTIDVLAHGNGLHLEAIFTADGGAGPGSSTGKMGQPGPRSTVLRERRRRAGGPRPTCCATRTCWSSICRTRVLAFRRCFRPGIFPRSRSQGGQPVVILDRPNPLNGAYVQGPVSDAGHAGPATYQPLPVRYGMTVG